MISIASHIENFKKNSLATGAATYLISNIINSAIPFFLLPLLTRHLSPSEYGEVTIFQTCFTALTAFTGLSTQGIANIKYYNNNLNKSELKETIVACIQILLISTLIIFIGATQFSNSLSDWLNLRVEWLYWAVLISSLSFLIQLRMGQWQVRKQALAYGGFQVSQSFINVILSIIFVIALNTGANGRVNAIVITQCIFGATAIALLKKDNLLSFSFSARHIKEALAFGVPLIPHMAGIFLLNSVDRIVINGELGLDQAGIYMVAVQLSTAMAIIFDATNKAFVPWLFEKLQNNDTHEKQKIVRYTYIYFSIALLIALFFSITGPSIVKLIAGEKYAEAGSAIGWLALGQAFVGMYLMVTNYVFFSKKTGLLSAATIVTGLLNVLLLSILVKSFSLKGAAIAFSASMCIRFLLTWWIAQKQHPMPWLNWKTIARTGNINV